MSLLSSVLFFGHDELLLLTRGRIFELAGFRMSFAQELRQVSQLIGERSVDLIVLCHSLSIKECRGARLIAESQQIQMLQLLMTDNGTTDEGDSGMRANAPATFNWTRGPQALLEEACSMLHIERKWTPSEALLAFTARSGLA